MSLTNFLLLLILSILSTYTFMTWKGIDKGSKINILIQFILWTIAFGTFINTFPGHECISC